MGDRKEKVFKFIKQNGLLIGNVLGAIIGLALGAGLKTASPSEELKSLIAYPGEIVIRSLQLLILPVVICSLIVGSASLNVQTNSKIALRTFSYFLVTSVFNAIMGILLAIIIHPGNATIKSNMEGFVYSTGLGDRKNTLMDNFFDLGRNIVPMNIFSAFFEQTTTVYEQRITDGIEGFEKKLVSRKGWNALGVIFYSLMFGCIMSILEDKVKPLLDTIKCIDAVNMRMITVLIWLTPIGVTSLICSKVLEVENILDLMVSLVSFIFTVFIGLAFYQFFVMQLIYFLVVRKNPFKFYLGVLPAAITGFAVDSSSIAMPVTLQCLDEKVKVDPRISHFVVPIGVTINMDGTSLFISIASIFIAQMNGIHLGVGDYINICVAATAVSIAATGAPSSSLTLIFMVLTAINAPVQDVGILFAIDWFVDRMRTTNNILGDCYASAVVEKWSQKELNSMGSSPDEGTQNVDKEIDP